MKQIRLPGELFTLNDAIYMNDSIIIGLPECCRSKYMYVKFNQKSKKIDFFGDYPDFCNDFRLDQYRGYLWRHTVSNSKGTKFASFFEDFKMFRIYDISGVLEKEIKMEIPKIVFGSSKVPTKFFYRVVKSTDQYIFALNLNNYSAKLTESFPFLEIWDWKGNPIAKFEMSNQVFSFDVTKDNKKLYCIDMITTDKLFVYDIETALNIK